MPSRGHKPHKSPVGTLSVDDLAKAASSSPAQQTTRLRRGVALISQGGRMLNVTQV